MLRAEQRSLHYSLYWGGGEVFSLLTFDGITLCVFVVGFFF